MSDFYQIFHFVVVFFLQIVYNGICAEKKKYEGDLQL